MISIRKSMSELDRCQEERTLALECYVAAIRNTAQYAVELDDAITAPHREYLGVVVEDVSLGTAAALEDSRATLRALLRDYRDKAARYLNDLREELASTARALQQMVETMSEADGDHEKTVRASLAGLRALAESPEGAPVRAAMLDATDTIQTSLADMRRHHQVTVSQFLVEIQMLHKRIDTLERAASQDELTKLFTRKEMEQRIRTAAAGTYCLLLIKVTGFRLAEIQFDRGVAEELIAAFTRRLRNILPEQAVIARWGEEEFVALVAMPRTEAVALGIHLSEHLAGSYACLRAGKTVRPSLELRVGAVDSAGETVDRVVERVTGILAG
jgi:diguanylate cyclase (GGDEF)-like protein